MRFIFGQEFSCECVLFYQMALSFYLRWSCNLFFTLLNEEIIEFESYANFVVLN